VEEDTAHVEIMAVALLLILRLGLGMVVRFVDILIPVVMNFDWSSFLVGVVSGTVSVTQKARTFRWDLILIATGL
jgi:hypothetical protein